MLVPLGSAAAAGEELITPDAPGSTADQSFLDDELNKYNKNQDVWFMLMMVAFLMLFIRKFEWGVALGTLLVTAGSFITYMAINEFYYGASWNQDLMLMGVICAITVVIAIGVFLGTIKMWQYLLAGVLFAPVFVALEYFLFTVMDATDPGGSMLVHMCAAYFGLGVALAVREKRAFDEPMYTTTHSVSFVWLASMLLWMLWPSFVTALLPSDQVTWGMITCYMAGLGSIITTYLICQIVQKKVNPLIYTYAMLAGPVAIGSPLLSVNQWGALVVGLVAGAISALSFIYLQPRLCKFLGVLDVMGVHNLHGVAGWIGALSIVVITGTFTNAIAAVGTMVITLVGGLIAGIIIRATRGKIPDEDLFSDDADFIKTEAPPEQTLPREVIMGTEGSQKTA
ncbi:ammonium transporter [Methanomassiliicoccales archaeon RumEn M1]|nr:ammonium transporter [Methanomassiliicoccales archaeon RumEn M1]